MKTSSSYRFNLPILFGLFCGLFFGLFVASQAFADEHSPVSKSLLHARPKLIVAISIDQFRADYLMRFRDRFLASNKRAVGGFRYLMEQGAYFPVGQYDLLQSMTGPGHATILSGAYPYQMGIPVNEWYNQDTHDKVYCAEDQSTKMVGANPQKATHLGTSPKNFIGSTVGDELKIASLPSKVISIAIKDRASILMGGHRADLALWFEGGSRRWVSSAYYRPDGKLPQWADRLSSITETELCDLATECGLEMTETAAEAALEGEKLGQGAGPDLLAVSFSSHDYAGHKYGPNDPKMEAMTLKEDQLLAKFFSVLAKKVPGGLSQVIIVLTGDHGIPPSPDWLKKNRMNATGRIPTDPITQVIESRLTQKFGKAPGSEGKWVVFENDLHFYFNEASIREKGISLASVEAEAKSAAEKTEGIAFAITSSEVRSRLVPPGMIERQLLHTYFPGRSGNLILLPKPYYYEDTSYSITHMTGYSYDRSVPIAFAGFGIRAGLFANTIAVNDIAPTLSFIAGVLPPSLSEGRVLEEAIAK